MKTLYFKSYKLAPKLPLDKITSFFKIHRNLSWKEYVVLKGYHLEMILKYNPGIKQVYMFEFGCITFVNFDENEINSFLDYLESIIGNIDYATYAKYREIHSVKLFENGYCSLWKGCDCSFRYHAYIIPIVAVILAKSTALYKLETDSSKLLDDAEKFIEYLKKGRLYANSRSFILITAKFLRFEYDSINSIRIFDRSAHGNFRIEGREIYDALSEYYELSGRYQVVRSKIDDLNGITDTYSKLSFKQNENRLYMFEIFLLALFPVFAGIRYLIGHFGGIDVFRFLFR